ncbi:hypothetical protein N203_01470 [Helicobacter pylori UM084]|nr:hypothetical protein N203_01470 [Helicobacter pylori UM084]
MKKSLITLKLICLKKLTKTKKSLKTLLGRFKNFSFYGKFFKGIRDILK